MPAAPTWSTPLVRVVRSAFLRLTGQRTVAYNKEIAMLVQESFGFHAVRHSCLSSLRRLRFLCEGLKLKYMLRMLHAACEDSGLAVDFYTPYNRSRHNASELRRCPGTKDSAMNSGATHRVRLVSCVCPTHIIEKDGANTSPPWSSSCTAIWSPLSSILILLLVSGLF